MISMSYGTSKSSRKSWRWMKLDQIFTMRDIIHQFQPWQPIKFSTSSRGTEFKDILPWNISQMITKTVTINTRIVIGCAMKRDIPFWVWRKINGNWENNTIRVSQWRESHCRASASIRRKKSKTAGLWQSQSTIWVRSFEKYFSRWVDRENLIYVEWNSIKNRTQRRRKWSLEEKRSKIMNIVEPVENINKNPESFLEITPMPKDVPLLT